MRPIQRLPASVVSQIAAGEVIERPASAVKELLENAIDAGARSITIEVVEGGRERIRVVDDGAGIPRDQLPLAVAPHATSKLESADELFSVRTLGFRGEALASIAGVSDLVLASRPRGQDVGAAVRVNQGAVGPVVDHGCPEGTQVEVTNLFGSVPVRRKFLKSRATELGHISEMVVRAGLAHPNVAIRLVHNDRIVHDRASGLPVPETIRRFFGDELADALVPIDAGNESVRLHGYVAHPRVDRPNSQLQYLFVNGRFIRDRSLAHAILEGYRGLLMTGRYPAAFLFLEVPPEDVDVNVHPTKIEVRFLDPHRLYGLILSSIRNKFLASDLVAPLSPGSSSSPAPARAAINRALSPGALNFESAGASAAPALAMEPAPRDDIRPWPPAGTAGSFLSDGDRPGTKIAGHRALEVAHAIGEWANHSSGAATSPARPLVVPQLDNEDPDSAVHCSDTAPPSAASAAGIERDAAKSFVASSGQSAASEIRPRQQPPAPASARAIQLHNAYIVVETAEGMLLVDQHALHERILFEELRERLGGEGIEVQELLVPEPIEVTPLEAALLLDHAELLASLGIRLGEFGTQCVLLQAYPAVLRRMAPAELVRDLAHFLAETGKVPSREQLAQDLLHQMACKAAIKAGDPLTTPEIDALLARRHLVDDSHHCPHGRPTVLRFTLHDLERQFKRV